MSDRARGDRAEDGGTQGSGASNGRAEGNAARAAAATRTVAASWTDGSAATYDGWADTFERDLFASGYRLPAMLAAAVVRHVAPSDGPVLDAGCGTGAQAEPLAMLGYGPLVGIDLSERMLAHAKAKGIYDALHVAAVGPSIDVNAPDGGPFAAAIACGVITPGHAQSDAFEGLIAAVRPGGTVAFTLRDDPAMDPAYAVRIDALEGEGRWTLAFRSAPFAGMPYGEAGITHRVHVYRVR